MTDLRDAEWSTKDLLKWAGMIIPIIGIAIGAWVKFNLQEHRILQLETDFATIKQDVQLNRETNIEVNVKLDNILISLDKIEKKLQ